MLLDFGAPGKVRLPVGQEHGRTIPLADSRQSTHSITSSALASNSGGMSRSSALAVLRLRTNVNLVGYSIGMSPGFAPLRILSTKAAARRKISLKFTP